MGAAAVNLWSQEGKFSLVTEVEKLMDCSAKHRLGWTSTFVYQSTSCLFLFGLDMTGMSYDCALKTVLRSSFKSVNLTGFTDKYLN